MGFDTNDRAVSTVQEQDLDTPFSDLAAVYGSPVQVGSAADLQLDTGQSIQDSSGTPRLKALSDRTSLTQNNGKDVLRAFGGSATVFRAYQAEPVELFDADGSFTALSYSTSSSAPGTLSLGNSVLRLAGTVGSPLSTSSPEIYATDGTGSSFPFNSTRSLTFSTDTGAPFAFVDELGTPVAKLDTNGNLEITGSLTQNATL